MNCKKIQDKILTDYLDGEMAKDEQRCLEEHIKGCSDCREFLSLVKKTTIVPLEEARKEKFSEDVIWSRIQQEIHEEVDVACHEEKTFSFVEMLKDILFFPKPVFALGSVAIILMMVMMFSFNRSPVQLAQNNQDQKIVSTQKQEVAMTTEIFEPEEYLAYYFDENDGYKEYGTSVEQYFL